MSCKASSFVILISEGEWSVVWRMDWESKLEPSKRFCVFFVQVLCFLFFLCFGSHLAVLSTSTCCWFFTQGSLLVNLNAVWIAGTVPRLAACKALTHCTLQPSCLCLEHQVIYFIRNICIRTSSSEHQIVFFIQREHCF